MTLLAAGPDAGLFIELGLALVGLAVLTRLAVRVGVSAVPLYLLGGLAFGTGGLVPLDLSESFVAVGGEIGVVLLLFFLGLEYTGDDLARNLRTGLPAGAADLLLNFPPGLAAGFLLGWDVLPAVVLGGVTYISSSGIVARLLGGPRPETPTVLSVLVLEDLAMAVFLPVVAVLLVGQKPADAAAAVGVALGAAAVILVVAVRFGPLLSRLIEHRSDEVVLLTTLGLGLVVAGVAQRLQVSAAVGAFLAGVALSGPLAERATRVLAPLRDLFAALFFLFFGLQIDPRTLPAVLPAAAALALVSAATKLLTGRWAVARAGGDAAAGWRAGALLIARGEFSIVLAGLGAAVEPRLGPLAAAYVLLLAVGGPVVARLADRRWPVEVADPSRG